MTKQNKKVIIKTGYNKDHEIVVLCDDIMCDKPATRWIDTGFGLSYPSCEEHKNIVADYTACSQID